MISKFQLFAALAALSCVQSGFAVPIFANPLTNTLSGYASNDPPGFSSQQLADDFSFSTAQSIASITWYGNYGGDQIGPGNPTGFTIRIFADSGNGTSPINGAAIFSDSVSASGTATGVTAIDGHSVLSYSVNLSLPVSLPAGTYWLSIVESDSLTDFDWEWASTSSGSGATNVRRFPVAVGPTETPDPNWSPVGDAGRTNRAFILNNETLTVPDGGKCLLLLGTSCVALLALKRATSAGAGAA